MTLFCCMRAWNRDRVRKSITLSYVVDLYHHSLVFDFLKCIIPVLHAWICMFVFIVWYCGSAGAWFKAGGGSGPGVGVRRGLAGASWIILQPEDPPSPSAVSWTMRIKLLLFLNSENGRTTKTLFLLGPWLWLGAELRRGGREGGKE